VTIAKITVPGLTAMGVSVLLLWGCLIGERVLARNAAVAQAQILREINLLRQKQRSEPASTPIPRLPQRSETVKG